MFIAETITKKVLVVYPGRFQPFHIGHKSVYDYLIKQFGIDNVFIATSDKVDPPKSPFSFDEKIKMITATGIDASKVVKTKDPYKALELVSNYNPSVTILLFAVSEKDMSDDPRFKSWVKKDGSPTYFQPYSGNIKNCKGFGEHGYILTAPTVNFKVLNKTIKSASELRTMFARGNQDIKKRIIYDLYGKFDPALYNLMSSKIFEGIINFDRMDPMNSRTAPPEGLGSMPLRDWKKNLARRIKELNDQISLAVDPAMIDKGYIWNNIKSIMDEKSSIQAIARDIVNAHKELEQLRQLGGIRSKGINREAD